MLRSLPRIELLHKRLNRPAVIVVDPCRIGLIDRTIADIKESVFGAIGNVQRRTRCVARIVRRYCFRTDGVQLRFTIGDDDH